MNTEKITVAEIRAWAKKNQERYAPRTNEGVCEYTDAAGRHCLVGQFLADTNRWLPEATHGGDNTENFSTIAEQHSRELPIGKPALKLLCDAQDFVDNSGDGDILWGPVLKCIAESKPIPASA